MISSYGVLCASFCYWPLYNISLIIDMYPELSKNIIFSKRVIGLSRSVVRMNPFSFLRRASKATIKYLCQGLQMKYDFCNKNIRKIMFNFFTFLPPQNNIFIHFFCVLAFLFYVLFLL